MNPAAILNSQFVQVALPIVFTLGFGIWFNNKRIDDLRSDLKRIEARFDSRFDRLEALMSGLEQRVTRVEERTSIVGGAGRR